VNFADWSKDTDFVIGKSSGWYWKEQNTNIIYADYYFAEAIYKLKGFEPLFW
jgi:unsaturated chondroitin disaccharide hydrolase